MKFSFTCLCLACLLAGVNVAIAQPYAPADPSAERWKQVDEILARIKPPTFADRDFDITQYGAKNDGQADCTRAFADAIAACNAAGGGRVVVPDGTFLTGAIHLKSNVNLHLSDHAIIRFKTDPAAYLPVVFTRYESTEVMNYSPFIYAFEQENIAITGNGTLDGQASKGPWYEWKSKKLDPDSKKLVAMGNENVPVDQRIFGEGHFLRPNFVAPTRCKNVLIEGVTIVDSPMWVLNPVLCTNVTVRKVNVDTAGLRGTPNTDGCDPECSRDVLIEDCVFNTGDDCIAIKSGRDVDGRRVNVPSENIVVRNCLFKIGHGGVSAGSENSGGIRNVFAENCQFDSPNLNMAIRLKTNALRGGYIENFNVRNCTIRKAQVGIHITMRYKGIGGTIAPIIRNVDIRHCRFDKVKQNIVIDGLSEQAKISDVTISDCSFEDAIIPDLYRFSHNVLISDVTSNPRPTSQPTTRGSGESSTTQPANVPPVDVTN